MEETLAKYFSGEASLDERSLVESWRSESEENAKVFFESKIVWTESANQAVERPDILASILSEDSEMRSIQRYLIGQSWVKYAAAAVLVFAIGLLFLLNQAENNFQVQSLADGSEISIHGNSKVEVISMTENMREVKLTGKAYFDIERDESRPFIIHTDNAVIKVLGTSFVIDSNDDDTEVSVESGLVELIKNDGKLSVKLEKGELGLVSASNKGIIKKSNDNPNYLAWKTKVLTFKNTEISEVKKVLEDVYGIDVKLDNSSFGNCKLTAKINKKKAKDAIEIIARTFNIEYDFKKNKVILKGKGC